MGISSSAYEKTSKKNDSRNGGFFGNLFLWPLKASFSKWVMQSERDSLTKVAVGLFIVQKSSAYWQWREPRANIPFALNPIQRSSIIYFSSLFCFLFLGSFSYHTPSLSSHPLRLLHNLSNFALFKLFLLFFSILLRS